MSRSAGIIFIAYVARLKGKPPQIVPSGFSCFVWPFEGKHKVFLGKHRQERAKTQAKAKKRAECPSVYL